MPNPVKYLIDEHIPHAIASGLAQNGIDAITLTQANLLSKDDEQRIVPFALQEMRVIVTRDRGFPRRAAQGMVHAGIAFWPRKNRDITRAIQFLVELAAVETADSMMGQVKFIPG